MGKYTQKSVSRRCKGRYERVVELARQGVAGYSVAAQLGENLTTVQRWLKLAGVQHLGTLKVGGAGEALALRKLEEVGLTGTITSHSHPFDIQVSNGLRLEVKTAQYAFEHRSLCHIQFNCRPVRPSGNYEYAKNYAADCDFIVLVYLSKDDRHRYWVCRPSDLPKAGNIMFPLNPSRHSKWSAFENRFDLITGVSV